MSNIISEGHSILRPPYFDGKNYTEWKERMIIFIRSIDFKLWLVIKNGPKIPTKLIGNEEVEKSEDEYDEEDMKNLELEAQARNILCRAMNQDAFEKFSKDKTAKQTWDELEREMTVVDFPTQQQQPQMGNAASARHNRPNLEFIEATDEEAKDKFLSLCVPLYKFALEGNWPAAKVILQKDVRLKNAAIAVGWATLLHVAVGANHAPFVKELLQELDNQDIKLKDIKGNTAFCFAAASGNMEIVQLLKQRVENLPIIRGGGDHTPLYFAVMQRKCDMVEYLYDKTKDVFDVKDRESLFFTSITTRNYHLALKMATECKELAYARDHLNNDTALHILAMAHDQNPLDSCCHCSEQQTPIMINPGMKKHVIFQLVKFLWETILREKTLKEAIKIISEPSQLLFDAAEVGNFGFLSELISAHPSLIWEVDDKKQSIIHTAVSHRHASIFNVVHEIGSIKDIIVEGFVKGNNTLLHLAAKLAPSDRLELVSGAAFQMSHELIWFEEVKKIMPPSFIMLKNSEDKTAQELFTREHEGLRRKAEDWMKRTAEFCILISTVIATAVFSAAINIPGGIDDQTKKPNYLDKTSFLVFAISDGIAFISSATSILIFLSILISRYAEYDFHKSLPFKLICGLVTLFISITCMMVAFGSAFFITYDSGLKVVPDSISILASVPILLYITLQFSLWKDIIYSTIHCRNLFKPSKRMIHISSR
ncbi:uncharacterized protein LOC114367277 [Glycine soja]|uniref:PGG domain-containing protein n=1 Tax=Glycine soja TaxID=3848 RepID=A0A445IXH4_GLYSO|nr:uncharacterized protein LOC114367277 [Glycine soja]XP_028180230.1 uncharacterized protein LOC114367277 [Glycine soja]XP_028180231.1 uncharacterized protein LOC114367277 [Glycine soja]XP_028180232.1 uncharacterized protein LOC114367277 [Glycine soja]XP_028180233.1 uncharacterized protein LOC114367277 [Glycine soja]XP_028180234.1 uncharacterized protein LOC114367277 [Glycine soja]XP_028180236.1 uncharacterized protein LOC114367277 [Glycine soja]RZB90710.1 hypothetical protein D0Y65_023255 [